jgi:hypothetical protein
MRAGLFSGLACGKNKPVAVFVLFSKIEIIEGFSMSLFYRKIFALALGFWVLIPVANSAPIAGVGTWESTLSARDLDGDARTDAFFDSTLNITWLADANIARRDNQGGVVGIEPSGTAKWNTAVVYVQKMNSRAYLGQVGWRLLQHVDIGNDGCPGGVNLDFGDCGYLPDPATGELAHMFFVTLGNLTVFDPATGERRCLVWGCVPFNTGPFVGLSAPANGYWYGQENVADVSEAWIGNAIGMQYPYRKGGNVRFWPVLDGDIGAPVFEPIDVAIPDLPPAIEGRYYIESLSASGGRLPYQWFLTAGTLPPGLFLDAATGIVSGVPNQSTSSQVQFMVFDANQDSAIVDMTLVVNPPPGC